MIVERKEEALAAAKEWREHNTTVWTDGSRMENGAVGAAAVYKERDAWRGAGTYLGRNKEVFDAEVFAIHQALHIINDRDESNTEYTVFSDSQAAISRVQHDRTGRGQALAIATIRTARAITDRGNNITLRWTPSHAGVEGNERADDMAKRAADGREESAPPSYLGEASLSHLSRVVAEARSSATVAWIRDHCGRNRRCRPPRTGRMRKALNRVRKETASRFYQLLSGHAAVAEHLVGVGQASSISCFWCGSGERQTRHHLLVKCRRWTPEIRKLWQRVRADSGWGGAPSVRRLFGDERNAKAILEFLEGTKVGKMPSRILLAGGPDVEEEEWKGFPYSYWRRLSGKPVQAKKRMGQALPSRMYPFFCSFLGAFFLSSWWCLGRRSFGIPHYNRASWFEVGKG